MHTASQTKQQMPAESRQERSFAINQFADLMAQIVSLANLAAKYPVPSHWRAKATCLEKLAALKLHRVVGQPDCADAQRYMEDVRDVAAIIDPFILAIGDEAASTVSGKIDISLFEHQLRGALEGNAIYDLELAGERLAEHLEAAE